MDIDRVKADIIAARPITAYLQKSKGKMYCCPFCGSGTSGRADSTGAVSVMPGTNDAKAKCFSCDRDFDAIDIYQEQHSTDFITTLREMAGDLGIYIDDASEQPKKAFYSKGNKNTTKKETGAEMSTGTSQEQTTEEIKDYSQYIKECAARITEPAALEYLTKRGISIETARAYNLGYDAAADYNNTGYKCARLIIPMSNTHLMGRDITGKDHIKTLNTKSTVQLFNAAALYDNNKAVFITEGAFDALSIIEAGGAAIALNSASNRTKLLEMLQYKPTNATIVLLLDNDITGQTATEELIKGLKALYMPYIVAELPQGYKDANELLQADKMALQRIVTAAKSAANKSDIDAFFDTVQTEAYKPYQTGINFIDELLGGGIAKQTFLAVMAAPGAGKTTLCQQIAEQLASNNRQVIYLNLEMSKEQMLAKAISQRLAKRGINYTANNILQGYCWSENQRKEITAELMQYKATNEKYIKYNPADTSSDIEDILKYINVLGKRSQAAGIDAPVVIIDYLHLISSSKGLEDKELIKQAVTGLKRYAIDFNTFVIGIVATNRESNKGYKITLESGRDSSNIEYTADYVLSLNYYEAEATSEGIQNAEQYAKIISQPQRKMLLRVLKGRMCAPGKTETLIFKAAQNIFYGENDLIPGAENTPFDEPIKRKPI